MVIRIVCAEHEADRSFKLEKLDHARPGFEKSVNARMVVAFAQFMAQVGVRLLYGVGDAGALRRRVARNPQPAAGQRRGAAKAGFPLHYQRVQPEFFALIAAENPPAPEPMTSTSQCRVSVRTSVLMHLSARGGARAGGRRALAPGDDARVALLDRHLRRPADEFTRLAVVGLERRIGGNAKAPG